MIKKNALPGDVHVNVLLPDKIHPAYVMESLRKMCFYKQVVLYKEFHAVCFYLLLNQKLIQGCATF